MSAENPLGPKQEKPLVPFEKSIEIAQQLIGKYKDELAEAAGGFKAFDEGVSPFKRDAVRHSLEEIPSDVLAEFHGHGVVRGTEAEQLAALLNILDNGSLKGYI